MYEPFVQPPEIGRNLSADFREADCVFKDRVARSYALGLPERGLAARLQAKGFMVLMEHQLAPFKKADFPCTLRWLITWKSADEHVTEIERRYESSCL